MSDSLERRKFGRVEIDVAVKGKITDPHKKTDISGDISLKAKNLSEGGALLEWPRSWPCETCFNCLGWVHNSDCKLKEKETGTEEFNKDLVPEMHITIRLTPGDNLEPVETLAKITWVKIPDNPDTNKYDIGVSFVESDKKDTDVKKKILVIKKRFESS